MAQTKKNETPQAAAEGRVEPISLVSEMQTSYLDYAMSVIVSRALPDVRDGLKPVHRRILYAMWKIGLRHNVKFRKSAHVVGEVMAKYHPHGDSAIYDSLVRMAQDFNMRATLVDGQGNFGSMDGDAAAAMRYCVTGDTLLSTDRGLIPIESLSDKQEAKINIAVSTYDGKQKRASRFFNSGKHAVLTLETDAGYSIRGTKNHPLLTWTVNEFGMPSIAWKLIGDIQNGDTVILSREKPLFTKIDTDLRQFYPIMTQKHKHITLPSKMTESLAFLLGALVSEGSFHQKKILFNNKDTEFYARVKQIILATFPGVTLYERQIQGDCTELDLYHRQAVNFLKNIGLAEKKSHEKSIPHSILTARKTHIKQFLTALFEGDGSVQLKTDIRHGGKSMELAYHSKSRRLIAELKILLLQFGIATTTPYLDKRHECYKLVISGVENIERFRKEIGFFSEKKQVRLNAVQNVNANRMSKSDFIPHLTRYLRKNYPDNRFITRHNFDRYNNLRQNADQIKAVVSPIDKKLIDWLLAHHYFFDAIKEVRVSEKKETVYSIRVDSPCHSFVANGFINHNTETRLKGIAEELLTDIEKETVNFSPTYDGSHKEPRVLPSKLPNLLLNGSMGIAVGMATNIPPHNLGELCDAVIHLIDNKKATVEDLVEFVKGPDFPTGGIIYSKKDILAAYATGRGGIVMRAKTDIEEDKAGQFRIIVSEVPYQVNKAALLEKIAGLVQEKKIEGIRDLRDESNKEGVRIVIELKKDSYPKKILNQLFKLTELQGTFHVNMLALVDGIQPRVLNLKTVLEEYIKHRQEVITRRTQFDLERARERAHILEGLKKALDKIDAVIDTIRKSSDKDDAKANLMKKFGFTERQTVAILEMRLQQLANLERKKIEDELKEKKALIAELEGLLASGAKILGVIKKEVKEVRSQFADERRTEIKAHGVKEFSVEDLIPNEPTLIITTRDGYIKRVPPETFKTQSRGGKGVIGATTKEEDVVDQLISTNTHDNILFFTTRGRVFQLRAYDIPQASRTAKGQALVNFLQLAPHESVSAVLSMADMSTFKYLVMVTSRGSIKKTAIEDFGNVRRSGLIALKIKPEDMLEWVRPSGGRDDIMIVTTGGQEIRFKETEVRAMGRAASGVRAIRLKSSDSVVGMDVVSPELVKKKVLELLVISEHGLGKRTDLSEYKVQGRGGSGIKTMSVTAKTGKIVAARVLNNDDEQDLLIISVKGQIIRVPAKTISTIGRATQGVRIMRFKENDDKVASIALL